MQSSERARWRTKELFTSQGKIPTYFYQQCPACGRQLRIAVEYLGEEVVCGHCGRYFLAADPEQTRADGDSAMNRANELLVRCSRLDAVERRSRQTVERWENVNDF